MKKIYLALLTLLIMINPSIAQNENFVKRVHSNPSITSRAMPYRLFIPENYDKTKQYPLVLFLHGAGERGNDNELQLTANKGATIWAEKHNQDRHPCFVLAPQCEANKAWTDNPSDATIPLNVQSLMALNILDSLKKEFSLDESQFYITGLSMGGMGTWDLISKYPKMFARAVPICGSGDTKQAPVIKDIPIWAFHSADDGTVNVSGTRNMVNAILNAGGNLRYTEYAHYGHFSWVPAYDNPEMIEWMFGGTLFVKKSHENKAVSDIPMPYRLYIPEGYDNTKSYPLILFLHGSGERGNDNEIQLVANGSATKGASYNFQQKHPCFILAPQCASDREWANAKYVNGTYNQDAEKISDQQLMVLDIIESLKKQYNIDSNHLFITGLSLGGIATWDIITRHPDMFAAAVPVCGYGDTTKAELIKDMPIWNFHSSDDPTVPVLGSRRMIETIKNQGGNPLYTEYSNQGHFSWEKSYDNPNLAEWLFYEKPNFSYGKHQNPVISKDPLPYRLYIPEVFDGTTKFPLVVFLHGAGERGTDNELQLTANKGATLWTERNNQALYPCFVLAPQCPNDKQWVNTPWGNGSYSIDQIPVSEQLLMVKDIIDTLITKYNLKATNLYITGLSMGGYGAWDFILRYPKFFKAAIPICGAGDPTKADILGKMSIWCFHSSDDGVVPVKGTRDMVDAINALGTNNRVHFYTEYKSAGHAAWIPAYNEPDLVRWLFTASFVSVIPNSTGINSSPINNTGINVYSGSNPGNISILIKNKNYKQAKIAVYTIDGKQIATQNVIIDSDYFNYSFDINSNGSSFYIVKLLIDNKIFTNKIILQ